MSEYSSMESRLWPLSLISSRMLASWGDYNSLGFSLALFASLVPFFGFLSLSFGSFCKGFYGSGCLSLIFSAIRLKMFLYLMANRSRACWNSSKFSPTWYSLGTILSLVRHLKIYAVAFGFTIRARSKAVMKKRHVSKMISLLCRLSVMAKKVFCRRKSNMACRLGSNRARVRLIGSL